MECPTWSFSTDCWEGVGALSHRSRREYWRHFNVTNSHKSKTTTNNDSGDRSSTKSSRHALLPLTVFGISPLYVNRISSYC